MPRRGPIPIALTVDLDQVRRIVRPHERTVWEGLGQGLILVPRGLLFLGLWGVVATMAQVVYVTWGSDRASAAALTLWGTSMLLVELVLLSVRDALALPWCGMPASAVGILIRALGGFVLLFLLNEWNPFFRVVLEAGLAVSLYAFRLPASLRSARSAMLGLRSLRIVEAPTTLGPVAGRPGAAGRRAIRGRLAEGPGPRTLHSDGILAHLDETATIFAMGGDREAAVVADVHVVGTDYRSGVRLDGKGLPIWILPSDDLPRTLNRFRRRLRLSAALDGVHVAAALAGGVLIAFLFLAAS